MKLTRKMIGVIDKQDNVGGPGGYAFDSGCNLSGLRKVHIELGVNCGLRAPLRYPSVIKRIFLEFNNHPTDSNLDTKQERHPQYFDFTCSNELCTSELVDSNVCSTNYCTFDLVDPNDPIVKVNVWYDSNLVTCVSFILKSGSISQLYGIPSESDYLETFEGENGSTMVGIHGCFLGAAICNLGITFATLAKTFHDDLGFPPNSNDDASTLQKEMESSCSVTTNKKEEKEEDESWAEVNDGPNKVVDQYCDISKVIVSNAGNKVVNGNYLHDGIYEGAHKFSKRGIFNGSECTYSLFKAYASDNTQHWYISIVPHGRLRGTSIDIDFYSASATPKSHICPPSNGWKKATVGMHPPPSIQVFLETTHHH